MGKSIISRGVWAEEGGGGHSVLPFVLLLGMVKWEEKERERSAILPHFVLLLYGWGKEEGVFFHLMLAQANYLTM